jgi:hypothetical protein
MSGVRSKDEEIAKDSIEIDVERAEEGVNSTV